MNRREFLQTGAASAVALGTGAAQAGAQAPAPRRPNLLYVFSDQHRAVSLPGEPFNEALAPALDAFRRANFSMERCVSTYPLCTPYRGILMSGRWPYQTGLIHNNVALGTGEMSLGRVFRDNGYHTGYVGKWHLQGKGDQFIPPGPARQGFEDWHVWARTNAHYRSWTYDPDSGARIQPEGWNCTRMTDQAVTFIEAQRQADKPWFLVVSWNPPHPPFNPPEEDADRYRPGTLKTRPNVRLSLGGRRRAMGEARALLSAEALQDAMQGYYGGITGVDGEFARLLDALDRTGQAADTIVVYTSDHGEMMGSHGRMAKQAPFEEACRVPFFVRVPGRTPSGGHSDLLFASVDIYPTLCGLAGLAVPPHCVGRDLSAVMTGGRAEPSTAAFLINQMPPAAGGAADGADQQAGEVADRAVEARPGFAFMHLPSFRGVRTATHTYAVAENGRWCLYDNVADPFQMTNLVADPAQAPLLDRLDAEIIAWLVSAGDPFPFREAVTRVSTFPT